MPGVETPPVGPGQQGDSGRDLRDVLVSARSRVQVTPHRLIVVLFIREYCQYKQSLPVSPMDRSAISLLMLNLIQSPDLALTSTASKIVEKVKLIGFVTDWVKGVSKLQEEGVAGMMDLVQSIDKLLTIENYPVNRSSVLGLFLRQVFLSFDKLTFSEVSSLNQQFDIYYKAGKAALTGISNSSTVAGESFEMSLESEKSKVEYKLPSMMPVEFAVLNTSRDNDDNILDDQPAISKKQAELFLVQQANLLQSNERLALPPQELQTEIQRILKSNPGLPEAKFVSYLNSQRVKEVTEATHSLYGSCNMYTGSVFTAHVTALNLASYHVNMDREAAMSTIKEAITMAQEAADHICLQHVLSLLHRIVNEHDKKRLLERCVTKSGELNLPYLQSLGLLSLATHLSTLPCTDPGHVLELIAKSDMINCHQSMTDLQAVSLMVKSAILSLYGKTGMSFTTAQLLLLQLQHFGEPVALAIANVVLWMDSQAKTEQADMIAKTGDSMFSPDISQWGHVIREARERINLRRCVIKQSWTKVNSSLEVLKAAKVKDADLLESKVLLKQGKLIECREKLQGILASSSINSELQVGALILMSDVFNMSGNPSGAVQFLVDALQTAESNSQELLYHLSSLHLANCHLLLGFPHKALSLIFCNISGILSHGGKEEAAKAWLLMAKCKIAASKESEAPNRRVQMLEGADLISKAKDIFSSMNNYPRLQDCLYLQARLYHSLQLTQERNLAASQFKKLEDLYPNKSRINIEVL